MFLKQIAFTGSSATGSKIMTAAAQNVKVFLLIIKEPSWIWILEFEAIHVLNPLTMFLYYVCLAACYT